MVEALRSAIEEKYLPYEASLPGLFSCFRVGLRYGKKRRHNGHSRVQNFNDTVGSYRQSAATSTAMKTQFQDFRATKILDAPVFRQTNILRKHPHDNARTGGMVFDITYPML